MSLGLRFGFRALGLQRNKGSMQSVGALLSRLRGLWISGWGLGVYRFMCSGFMGFSVNGAVRALHNFYTSALGGLIS